MVQSRYGGRYRLHDLLRLFANRRLAQEESVEQRDSLRLRVSHWLLETATVAGRWYEPDFGALPAGWDYRVAFDDRPAARQWLELESENWLAAMRDSFDRGDFIDVVTTAEAMHWFSDYMREWEPWKDVFTMSSTAAERLEDDLATATQLNYLAWALTVCTGELAESVACAQRGFEFATRAGDIPQQAWALNYVARAQLDLGDGGAALEPAAESARLFEELHDRESFPQSLNTLGQALGAVGRFAEALQAFQRCLVVIADPATAPVPAIAAAGSLAARVHIGRLQVGQHNWQAAADILLPGEALFDQLQVPAYEAALLAVLGESLSELGQSGDGLMRLRRAHRIYLDLKRVGDAARIAALIERFDPATSSGLEVAGDFGS